MEDQNSNEKNQDQEYEEYEEENENEETENNSEENEEIDAILNLDFEKALQVSRKNFEKKKSQEYSKYATEEAYYENQSQILAQQVFEDYKSELTGISQQYLDDAEYYKNVWQNYCKSLVAKQRDEANILEQRWREAREIEISRANEAAKTKLATARLLAMCKLYENAIDVRDKAQNMIDQSKSPEVKKIDREFAKQYRKMTKRHYAEFQYLYGHLRALMQTLRSNADSLKKKAEANLEVEKARNNTLIIKTVANEKFSQEAKEKLIQNFSPRNKGKTSPKHFSPKGDKISSPKSPTNGSVRKSAILK